MVNRVVIVLLASLAAAASPSGRAEFETGRRLFLAERYAEALPHLIRARELSGGRPSTIEAVALCHEKLGDDARALEAFRALIAADPDRADAAEVRAKIAALEAQQVLAPKRRPRPSREPDNFASKQKPTAVAPPEVAPPPTVAAPEPPRDGPPWLWIAIGAVAVVAAGVSVAAVASSGGEPLPESLDRRFVR